MNAVDPQAPILVSTPSNPYPEGTRAGYFRTVDNVRLRYGLWPRSSGPVRGTVCIAQGRTEYLEKYFETVADFQRRGFAVASFDWRGQGGSDRLLADPRLGYVDRFEDYLGDLLSFYRDVLLPDSPPPYYLVGHSMGGLVSLFAGIHDRLMFDRIFLTAPMLALDGQPLSMAGIARLAKSLSFLGLGAVPIRRRADRAPSEESFAGNPLTLDRDRYLRSVEVFHARPELELGSPTVSWLAAAASAMAAAGADDFPLRLKVPVLMLAAARDTVVSTAAIEQLGTRMRTGHHAVIAASRHEMFMETDAVRAQVFAAFDAFITEQSEQ